MSNIITPTGRIKDDRLVLQNIPPPYRSLHAQQLMELLKAVPQDPYIFKRMILGDWVPVQEFESFDDHESPRARRYDAAYEYVRGRVPEELREEPPRMRRIPYPPPDLQLSKGVALEEMSGNEPMLSEAVRKERK